MANNTLEFTVVVNRHHKTGLLVAYSDDFKGLYAHGRSDEDLDQNIRQAVQALLAAQGRSVVDVHKVEQESHAAFGRGTFKVHAEIREAA